MLKNSKNLLSETLKSSYYEYMIDHLQESLVVINSNYEIADANEIFVTKYNTSQPIGMKCYEITHSYDKPCFNYGVRCPLKEVIENKIPVEVLHKHKIEGQTIWENIVAFPLLSKNGETKHIIETFRDVSDL